MTRRRVLWSAMMLFALGLALAAAPHAFAASPNQVAQLKISVWPEYDQPTVLVMFDGTMADATNLPRSVSVLIPSSANLRVTTYTNADGTFAPEQSSQSANLNDGWTRVTFSIKTAQYHVEYYDNLLRGAPDKSMDYTYKADAPIDQAILEIQQPFKATNLTITPPMSTTRTDADGFTYYSANYANIAAGQTITAQVKYTKSDPALSIAALPTSPAPIATLAPAAVPASTNASTSVFLLVAAVVVGLVAVIGFFLYQQRARELAPAAASRGRSRRRAERANGARAAAAYCTQCGHGLGAEDVFCPRCGTKRRVM